jgi:hypothetical protein
MVRITIAIALAVALIVAGAAVEFDAWLDGSLLRILVGGIAVTAKALFGSGPSSESGAQKCAIDKTGGKPRDTN